MNAEWRWDFAIEILPQMLLATLNTILAAGIGYAIAAIFGLLFLLGQSTPIKLVNMINREIVEFIRSTPILIQLFFVYFVLPQFGITLSAWVCGMITVSYTHLTLPTKLLVVLKFILLTNMLQN